MVTRISSGLFFSFLSFVCSILSCGIPDSHSRNGSGDDTLIDLNDSLSCGDCRFNYKWMDESKWKPNSTVCRRFPEPEGFHRVESTQGSFTAWLRAVPLLPAGTQVHLYNGELKYNQGAQAAVIDLDVPKADLQQCADAVMRLRAEYLFATGQYDKISFNYTSGDKQDYARWVNGRRISVSGNKTKEIYVGRKLPIDAHSTLMLYMNDVFSYCGTLSLSKELRLIPLDSIQPGDVFIHGGTPGHAEIVMDVAVNKKGEKVFMLAQSYMPAQQMHILRNPLKENNSPWYDLDFGETLQTPEYSFSKNELMRW